MKTRIVKVSPAFHGHLVLELEDGTKQTVFRGEHEEHDPMPGDMWPPSGHEHVLGGIQTGHLVRVPVPAPVPVLPAQETSPVVDVVADKPAGEE